MSELIDKPKRRWRPRWSMRAMFLGVTVVCVSSAFLLGPAAQQKRAVEALRNLDGYTYQQVFFKTSRPICFPADRQTFITGARRLRVEYDDSHSGPQWLRELIGIDYFADVEVIECDGFQICNDDLRHLRHFPKLKSLTLVNCRFANDVDLGRLAKHDSLVELNLPGCPRGELLPNIGLLTRLERLDLGGIVSSDADLEHLKSLKNLKKLRIIPTLNGMPWSPPVTWRTQRGVDSLQKALPNCKIMYGWN